MVQNTTILFRYTYNIFLKIEKLHNSPLQPPKACKTTQLHILSLLFFQLSRLSRRCGKMATPTPSRPNSSTQSADFTRPQEPPSPPNLNRTAKRHQRALDVHPPPRLDLGGGANISNTASSAIGGRLDAIEREAKIQRTVMHDFASTVDKFVSSYQQPEKRTFAQDMCDKIVSFLTTSLSAGISSTHIQSQFSGASTPTFAGIAKTLKNTGVDFHTTKGPSSSFPGRTSVLNSGDASLPVAKGTSPKQEDRRLLVSVEPGTLLQRPEPFALRQELCSKVKGLTLARVPSIAPTRTGWAITPSDFTTRDLLSIPENSKIIMQILHGTAVKQPETWYNYAVPGVSAAMHQLFSGPITCTTELVTEEVMAQTHERPVSCRPSRHGVNLLTGKITWIVSFLKPVRPFRLFNSSELSKLINKKPTIVRHDPGCQGFCNPAKCSRYARCSICSTRIDQHIGPPNINCTAKAKCANCHGPFPAGHQHCPATPKRKSGIIIRPTKKELDAIRRHGDREFRNLHNPADNDTSQDLQSQPQEQSIGTNTAGRTKRKRGSVVTAYENAASQVTPSQSLSQISTQLPSSHSQRSTVSRQNFNPIDLSAESFACIIVDDEIDKPSQSQETMQVDASNLW